MGFIWRIDDDFLRRNVDDLAIAPHHEWYAELLVLQAGVAFSAVERCVDHKAILANRLDIDIGM